MPLTADQIMEILQDRISDAVDGIEATPVDHPDGPRRAAKLSGLLELKRDLNRERKHREHIEEHQRQEQGMKVRGYPASQPTDEARVKIIGVSIRSQPEGYSLLVRDEKGVWYGYCDFFGGDLGLGFCKETLGLALTNGINPAQACWIEFTGDDV